MISGLMDSGFFTSDIVTAEDGAYLSGGQVMGVSLGYDFASEHERGIAKIRDAFGLPKQPERSNAGADFRTITKVPDNFKFFPDLNGSAYLIFSDCFRWCKPEELTGKFFDQLLGSRVGCHGQRFATAWSERDFGVRMKNTEVVDEGRMALGQIYDAFINGDGMIYLGGPSGMGSRSLVLMIRSRIPDEGLAQMKAVDESVLDLVDASHATGIIAKLDAANMDYMACSPRWLQDDDERRASTKYPVIYWLNPDDQENNNYGWFTVEELEQWIEGKGPIPMAKEEAVEEE